MNSVEIEAAISALAGRAFAAESFPFDFLEAFGNKETTIKRLKSKKKDSTNASDLKDEGAVLQRKKIHILVCPEGETTNTLTKLRESPATARAGARFILATDGLDLEAEDLSSDEPPVVCKYKDFAERFGFFLPLAGITTVKAILDNPFDIRATGRLNRLYIELLKDNPEWDSEQRRHDMNHFMARLIFCFFAEDTDIFNGQDLFTDTLNQMSESNSSNTHEVISEIFRAMDTPTDSRAKCVVPRWADPFPYVNGKLFSGNADVPRFSRMARSHLIHIGKLDWEKINPDIFGSMIQAVTDAEERGALGLHYTSVPNILKVLNPLFLDDLKTTLEGAGDSPQKLFNLRKRLAGIRVFDPACGSGNFLVIAYKEMRALEAEINKRRAEPGRRSDIRLTNFRGIELRDFPAEIARLALIIAEYQCDVLYLGQKEALAEFLPLDAESWIICGNALRLDWLSLCPPTGVDVRHRADDLFSTRQDQAGIEFANQGGETYICGNPPYLGSTWQSKQQKADLEAIFCHRTKKWKSLDYVAGWFMKAADYGRHTSMTAVAFVSTNSICQGQQVPILWPLIFASGHQISFAHTSFKWANLASHNAGVAVVIVGLSQPHRAKKKRLFSINDTGESSEKEVARINAYLIDGSHIVVEKIARPKTAVSEMIRGNMPVDGGGLLLNSSEVVSIEKESRQAAQKYIRKFVGSEELINGKQRYCLWIEDQFADDAKRIKSISERFEIVKNMRSSSSKPPTVAVANTPHKFGEIRYQMNIGSSHTIVVPRVSSENRDYLPVGVVAAETVIGDRNFALYDSPLWNLALLASCLHRVWIAAVCARLGTSYSYSNTLGWNTFPLPGLTQKNRDDLTKCAEDILLAREAYFPATIADLYAPKKMPDDLRRAHDRNDDVLERIYIGRRFKNDTERLERLFHLYSKMTARP